ncbi:MAG: outer membrane lipoprotein carrier protein LolA [Rhodobacteraceae bacterium]|nr:outer membrane lipoprotein carrier protein LolA [Paracoccaceae bacterium]
MKKIALAFALIFSASPLVAQENALSLAEISVYLNSLKTAEATFKQINDDGSQSSGRLYLKRPGRMRLEYDPPVESVVVAGAGAVVIFDPKSNNHSPETYPLRRTPLSIILKKNVNLGAANMVVGHRFDGQATVVTAQDPKRPDIGQIDLIFDHNPTRLSRWVIHDGTGAQITVNLSEMETGMKLHASLFNTREFIKNPDR